VGFAVLLTMMLLGGLNVIGVAFTGMEHVAHALASLAVVVGFTVVWQTHRIPWWMSTAILVGPLLRFEGLAVSLPALLILGWLGHRRAVVVMSAILITVIGAYTAAMMAMDLPPLPSSVMVKSNLAANLVDGRGHQGILTSLLLGLKTAVQTRSGLLLFLLAAMTVLGVLRQPAEKFRERPDILLALLTALAVAGHLLAGKIGLLYRYEVYILLLTVFSALFVWRDHLTELLKRGRQGLRILLLTVIIVCGLPYFETLALTPLASNNIYEQQYQMHRFITEFYRKPVAVNDLGWPTYRNEKYVLDLLGLASEPIRRQRRYRGFSAGYLAQVVREENIGLVMIYDEWFPMKPKNWLKVAMMHLGKRRVAPARGVVSFYVTPRGDPQYTLMRLREFHKTLPSGVALDLRNMPSSPAN
jgi:hypothetical protein